MATFRLLTAATCAERLRLGDARPSPRLFRPSGGLRRRSGGHRLRSAGLRRRRRRLRPARRLRFLRDAACLERVDSPVDGDRFRPGTALRDLREERLAHLVAREGHGHDDQHGGAREEPETREPLEAAGRRDALERDRGHEAQPDGERRAGLAVREDEGREREQRGLQAEEALDGERHDQHEEEPEQRPARGPGAGHLVDAGRGEQAPAGRNVQRRLELLDARRPADGGQRARQGESRVGLEQERRAAQLDARGLRLGMRGDELILCRRSRCGRGFRAGEDRGASSRAASPPNRSRTLAARPRDRARARAPG